MMELIESFYKGMDRSLLPGGALYAPGATWQASAMQMSPLISPVFYRVDQAEGRIELRTDTRMRRFQGNPAYKIYNTRPADQNRLLYKKHLTNRDKDSRDEFRMWEGTLSVLPGMFEAFVIPSGANSYLGFIYANGKVEFNRERHVRFWFNTSLSADVNYETMYYAERARATIGDQAVHLSALRIAKDDFKSHEDVPWIVRIRQLESQ
jgi:hypothetical protein